MTALNTIACILLAAGRSERFGPACKLSQPWQGKALGDHAADRLARLRFGTHVAVVRAAGFVPADPCYRTVRVSNASGGIAHSIATGVAAIAGEGFAGALIVLADMPLVPETHLLALAEHGLAATGCDGRKQVPALFSAAHFAMLMTLEGDSGAAALLRHAVAVPAESGWLLDFDRPADFG